MIRINLLGRTRPKATRTAVPLEATLQIVLLVIALVASVGILYGHYLLMDRENKTGSRAHPEADGRKGAPGTAQAAGGQFREAKGRPAAKNFGDRRAAAEPHRRPGTSGRDCQHGEPHRYALAHLGGTQRRFVDHQRIGGIDQRGRELHHATEALRLFPAGGNQGIASG